MLNITGEPLTNDGSPTFYLTGTPENSGGDYHEAYNAEGKTVRLVFKDFTDWDKAESLTEAADTLDVLLDADELPYDEILGTVESTGCRCVYGRSTVTGYSYVHRHLGGGRSILLTFRPF